MQKKLLYQLSDVDFADCWTVKRHLPNENYSSILHLFPYEETRVTRSINCEKELSIRHYVKWIETWSSAQTYKQRNGESKFNELFKNLADSLVECYRNKNMNIDHNDDGYDTKIIAQFPVNLYLMRKK